MGLAGLLVAALGARVAIAGRVLMQELAWDEADDLAASTAAVNQSAPLDHGCYCKEVESVSECYDNKYAKEPERSDGPRYFHAGVGSEKTLCCKLEENAWYNFVGWAYTKSTLDRCMQELRPLPETKCCLLKDKRGVAGIRVRSARSRSVISESYEVPEFRKSVPFVQFEDIVGAEDHDGTQVPMDDLRVFLERRFTNGFKCKGTPTMERLFSQGQQECRLREAPTSDCCCVEASLTEVDRCFPVDGAATGEEAAPQELESLVTTTEKHGYNEDTVRDMPEPREGDLPKLLEGLADPEQQDLAETPMNEAEMVFAWVRAGAQWSRSCSRMGEVQKVKSRKTTVRVRDGQRCRMVRMGRWSKRQCTPKYKQVTKWIHSQTTERTCLQWRWTRTCPAGQGLYRKRIDPGTCMREDTGLQQVAPLSFACPAGYASKFQNSHCSCPEDSC